MSRWIGLDVRSVEGLDVVSGRSWSVSPFFPLEG